MKTTICFSGFAGEEAVALQAESGKLNPQWECWIVPDAAGTIKLLQANPCDVLVVNMPGLAATAVGLLKETGCVSHRIFRFIVGDVDDQSQVINSIGGSHQFIRRPVETRDLVKNIQRGLKVDAWLSTDELRALVPRLRRLPSLPSTYFNLLKETDSPSATLQGIAAIIARDPVVTARLLQMVNSAAFSLSEKVTNPTEAVGLLGVQTIKSLTLCLQVYGQNDEAREAGLSLEILWEHSLLVAKFARTITLKQTGDSKLADEAFTVGLLHDLGRIVMATNMPREYAITVANAREKSSPLHEQETAQFGVNHAKVGAYLLGLWGLPAQYIEATAAHHAPGQTAFSTEFSLLSAVHAANVFAHEMAGQTDGLPQPQLDLAYYQTLQLDDQLAIWRRACTGESTPENASTTPVARTERQPKQAIRPKAPPARNISFWVKFVMALITLSAGSLLRFVRPKPPHPAEEK